MNNKKNKKGAVAIAQIIILIVGIIAISYAIGGVDAQTRIGGLGKLVKDLAGEAQGVYGANQHAMNNMRIPVDIGTLTHLKNFGKDVYNFGPVKSGIHAGAAGGIALVIVFFISGGNLEFSWEFAKQTGKGWLYKDAANAGSKYLGKRLGSDLLIKAAGPIGWGVFALSIWKGLLGWASLKSEHRYTTFECKYWQPERGGENCELCNNQAFNCTEYQCKSLGGACNLINKDSGEPRCVWDNSRDVTPPTISPWQNALLPGYSYEPLPAGRGVEIKYTDQNNQKQECLPPFTPFRYGIKLDKDGACKIDDHSTRNFEDMASDFGGANWFIRTQKQWMTFLGVADIEAETGITINNDGNYEYYVRCESPQGKSNVEEFLFKFCIDKGPDFSDPVIRRFIPSDQTPLRFFEESEPREIDVELHINKPSQCRWSHTDKDYTEMENSLSCETSIFNFNAELNYLCKGNLTGLENRQENKFYFRCNSSTFGIVNEHSTEYTLIGTQPLVISSVTPNNTVIKGSSNLVKVTLEAETSAGHLNGIAACAYSPTGLYYDYTTFDNTDSHEHSTDVRLPGGDHQFYIQCLDLAGNIEIEWINFTVDRDTAVPSVVRAYRDGASLTILTSEEAQCVYDVQECSYNFEDGLDMTRSVDKITHTVSWDSDKTYYIKCADDFGNQPNFDQCSIEVKPFDI